MDSNLSCVNVASMATLNISQYPTGHASLQTAAVRRNVEVISFSRIKLIFCNAMGVFYRMPGIESQLPI
jgi:hypothetical protein